MTGFQPPFTFVLFQGRQAILQYILDVKRPERGGDEHPIVEAAQVLYGGRIQSGCHSMTPADGRLGPISPVKGLDAEFFKSWASVDGMMTNWSVRLIGALGATGFIYDCGTRWQKRSYSGRFKPVPGNFEPATRPRLWSKAREVYFRFSRRLASVRRSLPSNSVHWAILQFRRLS